MKRNIYEDLLKWKNNKNKKPLLIVGQRQVGKTYVTKRFAEREYSDFVYLNFMEDPNLDHIFNDSLNPKIVYKNLEILLNKNINKETLLLFDEIQESNRVLTFLKFLEESDYSNNLIATGSWVEAALFFKKISFPVGKVDRLKMFPMTMDEFIENAYSKKLIDEIKECFDKKHPINDLLHKKLLNIYSEYLYIGGMPEIVKNYIDSDKKINDIEKINNLLSNIRDSYINDLAKYSTNNKITKMLSIYDSLANNLNKSYNKFKYRIIKNKSQARDWREEIDFMCIANVTIPTFKVEKPSIPLEGYYDTKHFKLYFFDVGFLRSKANIQREALIKGKFDYLGWVTENFVACHLNNYYHKLFYWYKEPYEVDFLIETKNSVIPVEVKSGRNKRAKSLHHYITKYGPNYAIIISQENFSFTKTIINIPVYAVFLFKDII